MNKRGKMVSEKLVIILLLIAILLSVVSVVITVYTLNAKLVPAISIQQGGRTDDAEQAHISIIVQSPLPEAEGEK